MQVEGAKLGGIYNMGGACVASYVSLLEAIQVGAARGQPARQRRGRPITSVPPLGRRPLFMTGARFGRQIVTELSARP